VALVGREKRARAVLVALLGEHGVGQRLHVGRIGVTGVVGVLDEPPEPDRVHVVGQGGHVVLLDGLGEGEAGRVAVALVDVGLDGVEALGLALLAIIDSMIDTVAAERMSR